MKFRAHGSRAFPVVCACPRNRGTHAKGAICIHYIIPPTFSRGSYPQARAAITYPHYTFTPFITSSRSRGGIHVLPFYQLEIRATRPHVSYHWWALKGGAKLKPKTIGEHLKKRRLDLGLDQQQVADRMGVIWNSVSNWERGIYRPSKRAMPNLIAFLGYDPRTVKT